MQATLAEITRFLDSYLDIKKIPDESKNGIQVKGGREVCTVAFAVDACIDAFSKAKNAGAQIIVVHHGLFWGQDKKKPDAVMRERIKYLKENKIALYAAHLPLDVHKNVGNSILIARTLGLKNIRPFGEYEGVVCGVSGILPGKVSREKFSRLIGEKIGRVSSRQFFGPKIVGAVGVVSGGGSFAVGQMSASELDTLVSGEPEHKEYHTAVEAKVNAIYAGHYATERFGLIALSERLKKEFPELNTQFIESPTGL